MIEGEIDVQYALGELQNLQTEMEQYFGTDGSLKPERIEGIEARLKEQGDTIARLVGAVEALLEDIASNPYTAVEMASFALRG
ncbi:MAG TPA: hypothetical protein VIU37_09405 [Candidatus Limnocylindrales bacterium]